MTTEHDDIFSRFVAEEDVACFDQLFEIYSPRVLRFMRHRVFDQDDAQELVQQTFLVVYRSRCDFRGDSKFSTWLWAIAVNLRKDYLRKLMFRSKFRKVDSTIEGADEPVDYEKEEQLSRLRKCVEKLPEKARSVIELHWFEEIPFQEVAQILGITESAAKTRAHRAYEKLKKCVESA